MATALRAALHPLAVYALAHQLNQREAALFFDILYPSYRQLVGGHTRTSYYRALSWQKRSGGVVNAEAVMDWQERNAPPPPPPPPPPLATHPQAPRQDAAGVGET